MRLKSLLYLTAAFLGLALCGAITKYLFNLPFGSKLFSMGMSCTQVVGLILILINGQFATNIKQVRAMGLLATLLIAGYLVQRYSMPIGISLQLLGLLLILALYAKSFLAKPIKGVLDYLKLIWISSKITASFLTIVLFSAAVVVGQITNILFYTMLFYFIWISLSHESSEQTDDEQEAIS